MSREIRRILQERAMSFNIALDDVSITNLTFGREFTAAIEAKQVAAQDAERAKFVVEKAEQDKRSAIIRAQVLCLSFSFVACLLHWGVVDRVGLVSEGLLIIKLIRHVKL